MTHAPAATGERSHDGPPRDGRRRVVITGVGAVTPVGTGADKAWRAVLDGRSGIAPIRRFDTGGHRVRFGGEAHDFDPADWVDETERGRLDRFCHLALAAADMAIRDARAGSVRGDRVGTVFGTVIGGAETIAAGVRTDAERGPRSVSPLLVPSGIPNMGAGKIAMRYGFGGPSVCTSTACASSADAVGWGFRLIRDGYADACLTGGAESPINSAIVAGFANMRALSRRNDTPEAASRPFDAGRDGFVLSEGSAALMLESLEGARARGAPIYAEVAGYGQANDAFHETAPDPSGASAARAIGAALEEGELTPRDVDYVNAHGTSTRMSDAIESAALESALGERARTVPVSSTKSMTGHLMGAAGAWESIVCALAIRDSHIPPTINYEEPDPACALDYVPNVSRRVRVRAAISNSMGFGGHNVCLALRAADDDAPQHPTRGSR